LYVLLAFPSAASTLNSKFVVPLSFCATFSNTPPLYFDTGVSIVSPQSVTVDIAPLGIIVIFTGSCLFTVATYVSSSIANKLISTNVF